MIYYITFTALVVAYFIFLVVRNRKVPTGPSHVCANCRSVMRPTSTVRGSFGMEVLLWLCFLLPGFIYSMWRLCSARIVACPVCKAPNPIPLNSPAGQVLAVR